MSADDEATTAAAIAAWRNTMSCPAVDACWFLGHEQVLAKMSTKDPTLGSVRASLHTFARAPTGEWEGAGFPVELSSETALVAPSPSGALLARAVRVEGAGAAAGREGLFPAPTDAAPALGAHTRLEVSARDGSLVAAITLPTLVYADGWFEGLAWSDDEDKLVVVAEAPRDAPTRGYFADGEAEADGTLYEHAPDWGEAKVGLRRSCCVLIDLASGGSAAVLAPTSTDISAGTPVWGPGGESIVFCGTYQSVQEGVGYGVSGCVHRATSLFAVNPHQPEQPAVELLGEALPTARLPHLAQDGSVLRFVATREPPSELYTHGTCSALCCIDAAAIVARLQGAAALEVQTLIETVDEVTEPGAFPGLWGGTGAGLGWFDLGDAGLLINSAAFGVETVWHLPAGGSGPAVPRRVATQARIVASSPEAYQVMAVLQSPVRRPTLVAASVDSLLRESAEATLDDASDVWRPFWGDTGGDGWHGASWADTTLAPPTRISPSNLYGEVVQYHSVLPPESARNGAAVVYPHGGPHSVTTSAFNSAASYFSQLGYTVHLVNYRGSLSWGQGTIKALKGRCGDIDVADCAQVAADVVERGWAAADRLFFVGGSHSGFIGAHLAGQYPTLFQAFSLRNAVTNIAAMAAATDIGDWCLEEVGLPGAHDMAAQLGPDAEAAKKAMAEMFAASPHAHVHSVVRPVLQCVGDSDRRVPPFQARQFHHALQERGVDSRLLVYPGQTHPISKPDMDGDLHVNTARWFARYDVGGSSKL